jgi:tRNA A-37 threonylcarbamoyl transferase component Bud32/membrane-associated phospholipid phosphatase
MAPGDATTGVVAPVPRRAARRRPSGEPPPIPHGFSRASTWWLAATAVLALGWAVLLAVPGWRESLSTAEGELVVSIADLRVDWLDRAAARAYDVAYTWASPVIGWTVVVAVILARRLRHALVFLTGVVLSVAVAGVIEVQVERPRPYQVEILGRWEGFSHPSWTVAVMAALLTGALLSLVPTGRLRRRLRLVAAIVLLLYLVVEVYLGVSHPTDAIAGAVLGITITVLLFGFLAPHEAFPVTYGSGNTAHLDVSGPRGEAIKRAIEAQLGLEIVEVKPVGLEGSAGSTPLKLTVANRAATDDDRRRVLFAKLYAKTHLQSDRWYKLGRTLRYGRLEDEAKFGTVRRLVEYEDYLALKMTDAGIRVPRSYGIVEITPDREYVIVTDFLDGFVEIGDAEVDEAVIDEALRVVRQLWDAGLAHRDVKPSNLMVKGSEVAVIDVAFGQVRPSPWRQAIDLANMMLVLALRSDAGVVYERATRQFTPDEIAEAFAASRGMTLPSQVRQQLKRDSRDLLREFRSLAPARAPIKIQVWSWRRVALTIGVAVAAVLAIVFGIGYLETAGMLP